MNDDPHYNRLFERYAQYTTEELHDQLEAAKVRLDKANAVYMRSGLNSDKDAIETATMRFYDLQLVIRNRGEKEKQIERETFTSRSRTFSSSSSRSRSFMR